MQKTYDGESSDKEMVKQILLKNKQKLQKEARERQQNPSEKKKSEKTSERYKNFPEEKTKTM